MVPGCRSFVSSAATGVGEDEARLRALLATIARRRLLTRVRKHAGDLAPDQPSEANVETLPEHRQPRPSELAQAGDMWTRMLELCPPEHHAVLVLRREGLPLTEIANRTGLHEGSVRRILRRLARELALRQVQLPAEESLAEVTR